MAGWSRPRRSSTSSASGPSPRPSDPSGATTRLDEDHGAGPVRREDLENVLRSLSGRPGRWVLIVEDAARPRHFWQALCFEDGSLHAEVVSNHYLEGDDRLTCEQESLLRVGGWKDPEPPRSMCWAMTEFTTSPDVAAVAQTGEGARRCVRP